MSESFPPPIYSQTDPGGSLSSSPEANAVGDPQILIIPTGNAVTFQKGFLGVEGERAAIEGELQIKGAEASRWSKITVALRTVETADNLSVELGSSEVTLFSLAQDDPIACYSFAIPLPPDTPQSVHTSASSLSHLLNATLFPLDSTLPSISKTLVVETKRYTSRNHTPLIAPEVFTLDEPTHIEVEIPRTTFKVGEPIPVYVTVPPPSREVVIDQGLRLRNVRVELNQIVDIKRSLDQDPTSLLWQESSKDNSSMSAEPSTSLSETPLPPSSSTIMSYHPPSHSYTKTIARSGASCRFHSARPIRLRFVLHQSDSSPPEAPIDLPDGDRGFQDGDARSSSITQHTIIHTITFQLVVTVACLNVITRRERLSVVEVPVVVIAPSPPLPQVDTSNKKSERPPTGTVRYEEGDPIPHYSDREAGPSVLATSAPPPFEEQDAPPPFWFSDSQPSTSSRLPSFSESESDLLIPDPDIAGEGTEFGFLSSEQFDGHSEPPQRESPPPPSLEMATMDTDLTPLTDIPEPHLVIEALGLVIDGEETIMDVSSSPPPPPPPPAMDDPSDPPPCIDSDFRTPDMTLRSPLSPSIPHTPRPSNPELLRSTSSPLLPSPNGHDPPPYLNSAPHQEAVTRPPPYRD